MKNLILKIITVVFLTTLYVSANSFSVTENASEQKDDEIAAAQAAGLNVYSANITEINENATQSEQKQLDMTNTENTLMYFDEEKAAYDAKQAEKNGEVYVGVADEKTCVDIKDMKCPNLLPYMTQYSVQTAYINPAAGEVKCIVYDTLKAAKFNNFNQIVPVAERTFKRKVCADEFSYASNRDTSLEAEETRQTIELRQAEMKDQQMKYTVDYKTSGGETYLDLGDLLDALSTIDGEKINLEETLQQWEVKMKSGFTIKPNEIVMENFKGNLKDLISYYSGKEIDDADLIAELDNKVKMQDKNKIVTNSQYVMYLDFFVNANVLIADVLTYVLIMVIGWNVIMGWGFQAATAKVTGKQDHENHAGRAVFGVVTYIMLFVGSSENVLVQNAVLANGESKRVELETQRIQTAVRYIYSLANDVSDKMAKIAINSYLKGLNATSDVASMDMFDSLTGEKKAIEKEQDYLKEINEQCVDFYSIASLENYMKNYRTRLLENQNTKKIEEFNFMGTVSNVLNAKVSEFGRNLIAYDVSYEYGDLTVNPWPRSEREAFAIMAESGVNPYAHIEDGGLMKQKQRNIPNFNKDFISLSGCYYNKKKIIENVNRISSLEKKIKKISNTDEYNKKVEHLKVVHDMMWKNYAEMGYISIAFLPATSILIDDDGALGDGKARKAELESVSEDTFAKKIAESIPLLALFGGNEMAQMINNVLQTLPYSKVINKFLGDEPGVFSYYLSIQVIESMLDAMVLVVLITGSLLAFMVLALQKLWTFMATIFLVIYTFHSNQEEKVSASIAKMIAIAFKSVLLVVSIFVAIYSISLLDGLQALLVNSFFNNMGVLGDISSDIDSVSRSGISTMIENSFVQYSYIGVTYVGFAVIKIYVAYHVIFKLPEFFYELIETNTGQAANQLNDTIQQVQENQNFRGV